MSDENAAESVLQDTKSSVNDKTPRVETNLEESSSGYSFYAEGLAENELLRKCPSLTKMQHHLYRKYKSQCQRQVLFGNKS